MTPFTTFRRRNHRPLLSWLVALLSLSVAGCHRTQSPAPATARPLAVIVSCDTAGWIVPCGCSSKQAGGLLRRATYVHSVRQSADVLLADAGGAPGGASPYNRLKFESLLRGEIEMQTVAHNLGASEAEFGAAALRELNDKLHAPLISSNVFADDGNAIVPTHKIVSVGGKRIAVAGVLSRKYARSGLRIDDPHESLMKLIRTLNGQYDQLLVLAYLPEDELESLVTRLPEADMIVGGPTRQTIAPRRAGPSIWGATTNKGKFLVHFERPVGGVWDGRIVELDDQIADDDTQVSNLKRFRDELARTDFTADKTGFGPKLPGDSPSDFHVVGTDACRKCHQDDCQHWSKSGHSHAWQTLADKAAQMDPYCQHCHSTGYGLPGGFLSMASGGARHDVGCESCHGPAQGHVVNPATRTLYDARDRCVQCHDHDNSPEFNYELFWPKITHGEPANPAKDE